MYQIIIAVLSVTIIGVVCAAVLSAASKVLAVETDERSARLREFLPGSNCGACGFAGCSGYAAALISDAAVKSNLCIPGGNPVSQQLSDVLGVASDDVAKKTAVVRCSGDRDVRQQKMDYAGIRTCVAVKQLYGGGNSCAFGCLGYGDCRQACPNGSIIMENGLARVDAARCTGCGLCVKTCPNGLITIEDGGIATAVLCRNIEKGAIVRKKCARGCIGCGKCVRECPVGAITITTENAAEKTTGTAPAYLNLAVIDYEKCARCGHCADICVTGCIRRII